MFISLRVHSDAKRNEVVGVNDGVWQVRVAALLVRGKANRELIAFLGQVLDVGKSSLNIIRDETSRSEIITAEGLNREQVTKRLSTSVVSSR